MTEYVGETVPLKCHGTLYMSTKGTRWLPPWKAAYRTCWWPYYVFTGVG